MMKEQIIYDFKLDRLTPETLSMARLAQYLERLVVLFGNRDAVHFNAVRKGSAVSELSVDRHAFQDVQSRIALLDSDDAPAEILKVKKDLNRMLRDDDCVGALKIKGGDVLFTFAGRKIPRTEEITVQEFGELDGELIRVGGKDDTVPVWLKSNDDVVHRCWASKSLARDLAPLIFGSAIRVSGIGKWRRTEDSIWELTEFAIKSWQKLPEDGLDSIVAKLRAVQGSEWNEMDNPQEALRKLRGDEW